MRTESGLSDRGVGVREAGTGSPVTRPLLRSKLRPRDPVVRWGGDEFICTISDADLTSAHNHFEEIRLALAEEGGAPGDGGSLSGTRLQAFGSIVLSTAPVVGQRVPSGPTTGTRPQ